MTPGAALFDTPVVRRALRVCTVVLLVLLALQAARCMGALCTGLPGDPTPDKDAAVPRRENVPEVKAYEAIVEEEHFGKKPPPPRLQLFGILGDGALIGESSQSAQLQKVDAKLADDNVLVEVGADYVVIERKGTRRTLSLFGEPMIKPEPKAAPTGEKGPQGDRPEPPKAPDGAPVPGEGARTNERRP